MQDLHAEAWRPAGDAIQIGPPGLNEPPASEFEPVSRIAVDATGISRRRGDRNSSDISFDGLRKVCHLYESRCSGHYSAKTLAGRFLYQLSQEVQAIASAVERRYQRRTKRVAYLEAIVKEWEAVFGSYSETEGAVIAGISGYALTPRALHDALRERDSRLASMEAALKEMRTQHKGDLARFEKVVDEQFRASRARYREESTRLVKAQIEKSKASKSVSKKPAKHGKQVGMKNLKWSLKQFET